MNGIEVQTPLGWAELLDSSYEGKPGEHSDKTAQHVVRVSGEKVRLTVRWNSYSFQSFAKAELLTPAKTWTVIATASPEEWWDSIPALHRNVDLAGLHRTLDAVAAQLLIRARAILG